MGGNAARRLLARLCRIEFNDAEAVAAFIHRRGDPRRLLDDVGETNTGTWNNQAALLCQAAQAWEPADADGAAAYHRPATTGAMRIIYSSIMVLAFPSSKDLEAIPRSERTRIALCARTLATFMAASAARP